MILIISCSVDAATFRLLKSHQGPELENSKYFRLTPMLVFTYKKYITYKRNYTWTRPTRSKTLYYRTCKQRIRRSASHIDFKIQLVAGPTNAARSTSVCCSQLSSQSLTGIFRIFDYLDVKRRPIREKKIIGQSHARQLMNWHRSRKIAPWRWPLNKQKTISPIFRHFSNVVYTQNKTVINLSWTCISKRTNIYVVCSFSDVV